MVVWMPNAFGYPYDYSLNISKNKLYLAPWYAIKTLTLFVKALVSYDVYHFHFGRSILFNTELWIYRLFRKRVVFEFHGSDLRDPEIDDGIGQCPMFRGIKREKRITNGVRRIAHSGFPIILHDDELIVHLPEEARSRVHVVPLRVDIEKFLPVYPKEAVETVKVVHAPSSRAAKGTEYVLRAMEALKEKGLPVELILVEGKTQEEAKKLYEKADIIVDQLYAGTYGVFAIEGMALGKPVIAYIAEAMRDRLPQALPIVSATEDSLPEVLESLVQDGSRRRMLGIAGREYVVRYHDYRKGALRLAAIYEGSSPPVHGRNAFGLTENLTVDPLDDL